MSTIGRYIEAIEYWNHALTIDPDFSMARANRGEGFFHYANAAYDRGHKHAFLHCAYTDLTTALPAIPYEDAKTDFAKLRDTISKYHPPGSLDSPHTFNSFSLGDTDEEIAYRTWALQHRLFLNPINDLTTESVAAHDVLLTPSMVVPVGEPPFRQGFFNQLKQEYTSARWLLYHGLHHHTPGWVDRDVRLWNTLDYASYGTNLELIKLAYRSAYSLFDKIAFFLNEYLQLEIPERSVSFSTLWYESKKKIQLRHFFDNRPNLPLRGLYWLSRDLDEQAPRQLQPDAALLSTIRNHLEHKYLKAHEPDWAIAKGDPLRHDTLAYNIERDTLEQKALRITKLARAALLYLVLSVHIEEERRSEERGNKKVIGIPLDLYDDEWKK